MTISEHVHPAAASAWLAGTVLVSAALLIPAYAGNKTSSSSTGIQQQPNGNQEERVNDAETWSDKALKEWLAALDTNCDGVLDEAELAAADRQPATYEMEVKQ
jgi:hypothetical protein